MRLLSLLTLAALTVAGCSGGGGRKADDPTEELGLEATDTTGVIRGVVVDEGIRPLAGVTIALRATQLTATTNEEGAFGFEDLEPGTYFLEASKAGFKAVQQSTEVEAGVSQPPIVRVLLAADPTSLPSYEVFHFQGYLECSLLTGPFFWPCQNYATGENIGNENSYAEYQVAGNLTYLHVSMVWEPTQAFGRNLYFNVLDNYDEYQVAVFNGGPSPLFGNANASAIAQTDINEQGYFAFEAASDGEQAEVPDNPVTGPGSIGAGASLRQAFDAFIVAFYGFEPPAGYSYLEHGEPEIPAS